MLAPSWLVFKTQICLSPRVSLHSQLPDIVSFWSTYHGLSHVGVDKCLIFLHPFTTRMYNGRRMTLMPVGLRWIQTLHLSTTGNLALGILPFPEKPYSDIPNGTSLAKLRGLKACEFPWELVVVCGFDTARRGSTQTSRQPVAQGAYGTRTNVNSIETQNGLL